MTTGRRRAVAIIDGLVGLNAIGGMVYALGGAKAVPKDWLEDSPFDDYRIPGLYLGTVVGGTCLAAAIAAARDDPRTRAATLASSAAMLTWIGAQVAVVGYRSPLQPAIAAAGLAVGALAV